MPYSDEEVNYVPKPLRECISVILKLLHPLASTIGARWVWSRGRRYLVYMKLDPVKVAWIIRQKEAGAPNSAIASAMSVSERRSHR